MKLTLVGTGLLGRPIAERLLATGHELVVWNRTARRLAPLEERGARAAATAAGAIAATPVCLLVLADRAALDAVLLPPGDPPALAGRTLVQMGTIAPGESRELAERVEARGAEYLEAPVLGSGPQAERGELVVLAGGDPARLERVRPALASLGPVHHLGAVGKAAAVKLAFNQIIASHAATFSLALEMVRHEGLDVDAFARILRASVLHARAFDGKLARWKERRYDEPNFPGLHLLKDVRLARAEASAAGLATDVLEALERLLERTRASGRGEEDYAAIYEVIAGAAGKR